MNELIYLLAAMVLLAVLLYWNTQGKPYGVEHHPEGSAGRPHEAPAAVVPAKDPEPKPSPKAQPGIPAPDPETAVSDTDIEQPDDLTKIEGIGPKISGLLAAGGFSTYARLGEADLSQLEAILEAAGSRYRLADPTTWPAQARLAAAGEWEKLAKLQDELSGGRAAEG